ncbi:MAG: BBP7 family outer membrane beta-barrel protein [Gemmataceae bacterium]
MNLRIASAFAALAAGVGSLSAQGLPPASTPPTSVSPAVQSPYLGSAMPAPGAAGALPQAPALPPQVLFGAPEAGNQFYVGADYLLWKIRGQPIPQNVASIPVGIISLNPTIQQIGGDVVPDPVNLSTTPVFVPLSILTDPNFGGPQSSDPGFSNGARITLGVWADANHSFGVESSTFILDRVGDSRTVINAGNPNPLALNTGVNNLTVVVPPGGQVTVGQGQSNLQFDNSITLPRSGSSSVFYNASTSLFGTELNFRSINYRIGSVSLGSMAGVRYINFTDRLTYTTNTQLTGFPLTQTIPGQGEIPAQVTEIAGNVSQNLTFTSIDSIIVRNNFVGPQIGFDAETQIGALIFYGRIKFAVGPNFQSSSTSGLTSVVNNDAQRPLPASITYAGGQLTGAEPTGPTERTRYSFIPELNLKLGYQVAPWARLTVGYDGLYLGHMARSGLSIVNNTINTTVTTGGNPSTSNFVQPAFRLADHDAWVQGLSLGFELAF